jgi:hypothetical protein
MKPRVELAEIHLRFHSACGVMACDVTPVLWCAGKVGAPGQQTLNWSERARECTLHLNAAGERPMRILMTRRLELAEIHIRFHSFCVRPWRLMKPCVELTEIHLRFHSVCGVMQQGAAGERAMVKRRRGATATGPVWWCVPRRPRWWSSTPHCGPRWWPSRTVRRPFPSRNRSVLTEIYRCHACSDHEIEDGNGRAGDAKRSKSTRMCCYNVAPDPTGCTDASDLGTYLLSTAQLADAEKLRKVLALEKTKCAEPKVIASDDAGTAERKRKLAADDAAAPAAASGVTGKRLDLGGGRKEGGFFAKAVFGQAATGAGGSTTSNAAQPPRGAEAAPPVKVTDSVAVAAAAAAAAEKPEQEVSADQGTSAATAIETADQKQHEGVEKKEPMEEEKEEEEEEEDPDADL